MSPIVTYTLEKYSPLSLGLEDGYDEVVPPGWRHVQTFSEADINLELAKRLVANGGWRVIKQTVIRETLYQS